MVPTMAPSVRSTTRKVTMLPGGGAGGFVGVVGGWGCGQRGLLGRFEPSSAWRKPGRTSPVTG